MTNTNRVEDLRTELKRLHDELLDDYDEMNSRVLNKVEEARQLLSEEDEIGQWETELLDYAKAAVKVNFLRVAAVSVIMAIEVSQLPPDEYDWGFNFGKRP